MEKLLKNGGNNNNQNQNNYQNNPFLNVQTAKPQRSTGKYFFLYFSTSQILVKEFFMYFNLFFLIEFSEPPNVDGVGLIDARFGN